MANQIALNMGAWGDEEAVAAKTAEHLGKFWTADMLEMLRECDEGKDADLSTIARRALRMIDGE
jgi:hypothetical protein